MAMGCPGLATQMSAEAPFLWTASSMSGCLVTITTLTISVLPPWRIMFTTCRWPTFTTFCPFTCSTDSPTPHRVSEGRDAFSFRVPNRAVSYLDLCVALLAPSSH